MSTIEWGQINQAAQEKQARVIAISKFQPDERVQHLYDLGCRAFGENYAEGLAHRYETLPSDVQLHFVGALQSRKIPQIVQQATYIHSVSRPKELRKIRQAQLDQKRSPRCLIQLNIADEQQKSGLGPSDIVEFWHQARKDFPEIHLCGIMAMGPVRSAQSDIAQDFATAHKAFATIAEQDSQCTELSMGMSSDWEIALDHGATMLRVGSALFGARPT